jgi:predicted ATPase
LSAGGWIARTSRAKTEFRWHPIAVTQDVAVVQGETVYRTPPQTYSNLWIIRLDAEGRCTEFTEWWIQHPDSDSSTSQPADTP